MSLTPVGACFHAGEVRIWISAFFRVLTLRDLASVH